MSERPRGEASFIEDTFALKAGSSISAHGPAQVEHSAWIKHAGDGADWSRLWARLDALRRGQDKINAGLDALLLAATELREDA